MKIRTPAYPLPANHSLASLTRRYAKLLSFASDSDAFYGRLASAPEKSQRAIEAARQDNAKETAAEWEMNSALHQT